MIRNVLLLAVTFLFLQADNPSPLSVIREKRFYKTGAAAKNKSFMDWLKKPIWGSGSSGDQARPRPIKKRSAAFEVIRDQGYKDKEARMRAEMEAKRSAETEMPQASN